MWNKYCKNILFLYLINIKIVSTECALVGNKCSPQSMYYKLTCFSLTATQYMKLQRKRQIGHLCLWCFQSYLPLPQFYTFSLSILIIVCVDQGSFSLYYRICCGNCEFKSCFPVYSVSLPASCFIFLIRQSQFHLLSTTQ